MLVYRSVSERQRKTVAHDLNVKLLYPALGCSNECFLYGIACLVDEAGVKFVPNMFIDANKMRVQQF